MFELFLSHGPILAYLGIVLFLVLTGAGLPVPEEVPIVAAGVLSSGNSPLLDFRWAFMACLIGALMGDFMVYGIGRFLGESFFRQHPRFAHLLHEEREKQMEGLIQKHGLKIFFVARFMVGVRAPLYLAAGVLRVSWKRFLIVDAFCATIVVGTVFWLSHRYGRTVGILMYQYQGLFTAIVLFVLIGAIAIYYIRRRRRPPRDPGAGRTSEPDEAPAADDGQAQSARIVA